MTPLERIAEMRQWVRLFREEPRRARLWNIRFDHWTDVGICIDEIDRLVARVIDLTPRPPVVTSDDTIAFDAESLLPPEMPTPGTTLAAIPEPSRMPDVDIGWNAALVAAQQAVAQAFNRAYRSDSGLIETRTLVLGALRRLHRGPEA